MKTARIELQGWGSGFDHLAEQLRSMLEEAEGPGIFRTAAAPTWRPRLNLYEMPDRFLVCVELAGMTGDQIDVRLEDGILHIRGTRPRPPLTGDPAEVGVHLMEIDSGCFHRKLIFSAEIMTGRVTASYRNGYLWVSLPRRAAAPEDRR